jgi:hypothetical protein
MWRRPTGAESTVLRTRDDGATWEELPLTSPQESKVFPAALAFATDAPDQLYAGLSNGEPLASPDGGHAWERLDLRLPAISDLQYMPARPWGRGGQPAPAGPSAGASSRQRAGGTCSHTAAPAGSAK